ncbi:MAG: SDR family NAD(P)-dependent oxidoreductase [Blastochloris sp.]|nr:SDR family NAD(P)-dependent oxidoreductase [Blastochloris sp.]
MYPGGHIVGSRVADTFFSHYSAGKAALSVLLEGLWMELRPFGVRVIELRPGDIRTSFNEAVSGREREEVSVYEGSMRRAWEECERLIHDAPEAERVADQILELIGRKHPPALCRCGSWFQSVLASLGGRVLPRTWLLQAIRRYYRLDAGS